MLDFVEGPATRVIDGDTFSMRVEWLGKDNKFQYNDTEKIRLRTSKPEASTAAGHEATGALQRRVGGKYVHCDIHVRDDYGRLVCDVRVIRRPE